MKRREFLGKSLAASSGLLLAPYVIAKTRKRLCYSDAVEDPEKRQEYLDHLLEKYDRRFSYIGSIDYRQEEPLQFAIKIMISDAEIEDGAIMSAADFLRLENSYAYVIADTENFGKQLKSCVFVFDSLFDRLIEEEAKLTMDHENFHCKDIYNGMSINGYDIDASLLETGVLNGIMDLRAYHYVLEKIITRTRIDGNSFLDDIREDFIMNNNEKYGNVYTHLIGILKNGEISDYSSDVVRNHLKEFDTWIKPKCRYKD
jgi:hypothetical protein